jgi:hypothetical protein
MSIPIFLAGLVLLLTFVHDLVTTTLSSKGAGWFTRYVGFGIWATLLALSRLTHRRGILSYGGTLIMLSVLLIWLLGIWAACTVMIMSEEDSVMNIETNTPASLASKIYYTGYTLSTFGNGDLEPGNEFWEIFTAIFSFTGLIFISIALTYLLPVLSAEVEKQRLSAYISTLGYSVEEIIKQAWNGKNLCALEVHLPTITGMILHHAQNHHVYPVLHYFHTERKKDSFALNLTNLDEAITLIGLVPEDRRPSENVLLPLRNAISHYLSKVKDVYVRPASEAPPPPNRERLAEIIPVDASEWDRHYRCWENRRKMLLGLIRNDGWCWDDLEAGAFQNYHQEIEEGEQ